MSKIIVDINFYSLGYEKYIGLAIIQYFAAHWAIKNKEMVNVWKFDFIRMWNALVYDSVIESNLQTIAIRVSFIPLWAVKSYDIVELLKLSYPQK